MSDASTLDLAAALSGLSGTRATKGPTCTVGQVLQALEQDDPDGHAALVKILDEKHVSSTLIADTLTARGHRVAAQTIRRHRLRVQSSGCSCPT